MLMRGSRYEGVKPFAAGAESGAAFHGLRPRPIAPATGVIEHVVRDGDRLDSLARHYYNDDRLWWRIVDANPEALSDDDLLVPGNVILIPRARE